MQSIKNYNPAVAKLVEKYIASGMNEFEAKQLVILEEYRRLLKEVMSFKSALNIPSITERSHHDHIIATIKKMSHGKPKN